MDVTKMEVVMDAAAVAITGEPSMMTDPLDLSTKKRKRMESEPEVTATPDGNPLDLSKEKTVAPPAVVTEDTSGSEDTDQIQDEVKDTSECKDIDEKKDISEEKDFTDNKDIAAEKDFTENKNIAENKETAEVVRPSVVRPPTAVAPTFKVYQGFPTAASPLIADNASLLNHSAAQPVAAATYDHLFSAEYNPFMAAATAAANPPLPPAAAVLASALNPTAGFHYHEQQVYLQHQKRIHIQQQQQQLQMQIQKLQQQQQQHLATYGGGIGNAFDLNNPMMLGQHMHASPPMFGATPSPTLYEANQFPLAGFNYMSGYGSRYPYYDEVLVARELNGRALDNSSSEDDSDDNIVPDRRASAPERSPTRQRRRNRVMNTEVKPEDVAAIYRSPEFIAFRARYLESLGPPRNFEKMKRSGSNKKHHHQMNVNYGAAGQLYASEQTYVMKRQKNNEAAKRSRDAKRQKFMENQISVMYLSKKVNELKEIKRRLLLSM